MAGLSIGEIWSALRVDGSKAKADAAKAGGEAGDAASKEMGSRLKKGAAVIAGALSGALSVALIGRFAALERATAKFRQETGSTAEEAERAGRAINDMAGRNLQPVEEIGDTLARVTTDLGLTGDEASRTAEQFLRFGQATGQNAAQAVLAFDDILDAWGLTAQDAQGVMDALVLSHQKYGGSIEENQRTLAELAPALTAANLSWEDGVGILNMFNAAGVDAGSAVTGMQKALTQVKSPEELQALLDDITATEDPFLRATKAADLFGTRAGAKLATALGNGGLDDYRVNLDEAAGATDRAADASKTMVDRIRQAFSGFISWSVDTLGPAGPLLTAVGSLGTLFAPALSKVWKALVGNAGIKGAIALAGAAAGGVYSAAAAGVSLLATALSGAWAAMGLPTSKAMIAAVTTGRALGLAAGAAAAAAILTIPLIVAGDRGPTEDPMFRIQEIERALQHLRTLDPTASWGTGTVADTIANLEAQIEALRDGNVDLANSIRDHGIPAIEDLGRSGEDAGRALTKDVWGLINGIGDQMAEGMGEAGERGGRSLEQGVRQTVPQMRAQWRQMAHDQVGIIYLGMRESVDAMRTGVVDMKDRVRTGKAAIVEQFRDLAWQSKHPFREENYAKWLEGRYQDAMNKAERAAKRGKPGVAAQYRQLADEIKAEMNSLPGVAAENARRAIAALAPLIARVGTIPEMLSNAISGVFGGPRVPGFADGGVPPRTGPFWVGERGPELMTLNPPRIYDAQTSAAMAMGPTQVVEHIHRADRETVQLARDMGVPLGDVLLAAERSAGASYSEPRRF